MIFCKHIASGGKIAVWPGRMAMRTEIDSKVSMGYIYGRYNRRRVWILATANPKPALENPHEAV